MCFQKQVQISLALATMVLVSMPFSFLALSDIYKGVEDDLSAEWAVVRSAFFVNFLFVTMATITMIRTNRRRFPGRK